MADLSGTLSIELPEQPIEVGDSWTILTADAIAGGFDSIALPDLGAGASLEVSYGADSVTVTVRGTRQILSPTTPSSDRFETRR